MKGQETKKNLIDQKGEMVKKVVLETLLLGQEGEDEDGGEGEAGEMLEVNLDP